MPERGDDREKKARAIRAYYRTLFLSWGCQHWWPAHSRFEMIVGAYLTQNTAWKNVEKALINLRRANLLTIDGFRRTPANRIEQLIRPSGYFRQKTARLKLFIKFLDQRYGGSLSKMFSRPVAALREELLTLKGVGPETADSILLYAGNNPVFVVDAYTRRILERHQIVDKTATYEEIRSLCESALAGITHDGASDPWKADADGNAAGLDGIGIDRLHTDRRGEPHLPTRVSKTKRSEKVQISNEMHGLIVAVGKNYCLKSQPRCEQCPLQPYLPPPR